MPLFNCPSACSYRNTAEWLNCPRLTTNRRVSFQAMCFRCQLAPEGHSCINTHRHTFRVTHTLIKWVVGGPADWLLDYIITECKTATFGTRSSYDQVMVMRLVCARVYVASNVRRITQVNVVVKYVSLIKGLKRLDHRWITAIEKSMCFVY